MQKRREMYLSHLTSGIKGTAVLCTICGLCIGWAGRVYAEIVFTMTHSGIFEQDFFFCSEDTSLSFGRSFFKTRHTTGCGWEGEQVAKLPCALLLFANCVKHSPYSLPVQGTTITREESAEIDSHKRTKTNGSSGSSSVVDTERPGAAS